MIWIALYIASLLACGYAVTAILDQARAPRRLADVMGMSAALGSGALPLLLLFASMLGMRPTRPVVFGIAVIAIVFILLRRNHLPRIVRPVVPRMSNVHIAVMLLAGALIAMQVISISLAAGAVPVLEIDAWNIWGLKAKVLYHQPLNPRPEYFTDLSLSYTHLDYPLLVPMLWAGAYGAMSGVDDALGKTPLIVPLVGMILLLYGALRESLDRSRAALLTALAAGMPALARWGGQGLADTTLAVFMLGAGVCLVRWIRDKQLSVAVGAGLFSAFAIWTKLEGSILAVSVFLVVVIATLVDRTLLRSAIALLITLVVIALPWWLWSRGLPQTHENYMSRLTWAQLQTGGQRIGELLKLFRIQFHGWSWTVPFAVFLLAAIVGWRAFRRAGVLAIWLMLLIQIAAYAIAYLITPWNLQDLVPITATRLLTHVAPLAMLLAGLHWRELEVEPST